MPWAFGIDPTLPMIASMRATAAIAAMFRIIPVILPALGVSSIAAAGFEKPPAQRGINLAIAAPSSTGKAAAGGRSG